jgi:hypothetical protein
MRMLERTHALAAIAGGILRIIDSFATAILSAGTLAVLYFATDIFLLLGIAAIYLSRRSEIGIAGTLGAAVFTLGIVIVRVAAVLGMNGYQSGATIALLGLAILSGETLLLRHVGTAPAILWLLSLAFGVAGAIGLASGAMLFGAGIVFGAGFVVAGAEILAA